MTVYRAPRRGRDPLPIAVVVLALGVLTGAVLLLWARGGPATPVSGASFAAQPASDPPVSATAPSGAAPSSPAPSSPAPSSAAPSSAAPSATLYSAVRGTGSGLCLDVSPAEPGAGGVVVVAACAGTPAQRWLSTGDGSFINGATGLCLAVAGGSFDEPGRVQQDPCTGSTNQRWRAAAPGAGTVALAAVHSGKCLDVRGGAVPPGTPVAQVTCGNTPTQRWALMA